MQHSTGYGGSRLTVMASKVKGRMHETIGTRAPMQHTQG